MFRLEGQQAKEIVEHIESSVRRGELMLPPLPEIATRLMAMLDDEYVNLARVAELLRADSAIAASILRAANAAAFSGLPPCDTLDQALSRIGSKRTSALITTAAHRSYFLSQDAERLSLLRTLRDHALASAVSAKHLASRSGDDATEAYLAGLLHDIGKLLVLRGVSDLELRSRLPRLDLKSLEGLMEFRHAELGHAVLTSWAFPARICDVVLRHHESDVQREETLLLQIQAADTIATALSETVAGGHEARLTYARPLDLLQLGGDELFGLIEAIAAEVETTQASLT